MAKTKYWYGRKISYAVNGKYPCVHWLGHPLAQNCYGLVYIHQLVASEKLGKPLRKGVHTHHKDGNTLNYSPDNIETLTPAEHRQRHSVKSFVTKNCTHCGKSVTLRKSHAARNKRFFCNNVCYRTHQQKIVWPDENILMQLVWEMPVRDVGTYLGVSDNAVRKHCKKHNIPLPTRGHWLLNENRH